MNRMTDNDLSLGPFTIARWKDRIAFEIESGDDEDPESFVRITVLGWAFRCQIPKWMCPSKKTKVDANWDEATVKRLGRNWYYDITPRCFGFALTASKGVGYNFLQVFYGASTHDSATDKSWCTHLPWKEWNCVRSSYYRPDGSHFYTEPLGKKTTHFKDWYQKKQECPASYFLFRDFDGQEIIATCRINEMEWHRGTGWFKWMKWFWPKKVRRSLDMWFNAEVGPGKGSWKGGTIGTGIDMLPNETPQQAFERFCAKGYEARGKVTPLHYVGPCDAPIVKEAAVTKDEPAQMSAP